MLRFMNLEVLWLNDNKLSKLKGLEHNFRLKQLYLHNNRLATITNASCCLPKLHHLELLQLENNLLQDLKATLKVLQGLPFLTHLYLAGNPLANEHNTRRSSTRCRSSSSSTRRPRRRSARRRSSCTRRRRLRRRWPSDPSSCRTSGAAQGVAPAWSSTSPARGGDARAAAAGEREREAAALRAASAPLRGAPLHAADGEGAAEAAAFQFIVGTTPQLNVHASEFSHARRARRRDARGGGHPRRSTSPSTRGIQSAQAHGPSASTPRDRSTARSSPTSVPHRPPPGRCQARTNPAAVRRVPRGGGDRPELIEEASALLGGATLLGDLLRDRTEKTYSCRPRSHLVGRPPRRPAVDVRTSGIGRTPPPTTSLSQPRRRGARRQRADALTQLRGGGRLAPRRLADLARTVARSPRTRTPRSS